VPASLNGIAVTSWAAAASNQEGWSKVGGQLTLDEPALILKGWKKAAAGGAIGEADERIWLVSPTNVFGGYLQTFPKGKAQAGLPLQAVAIKECVEESGVQVQITGIVGDFERSTSFCRYYTARRVGGTPADCGWEAQAVHLVPKSELRAMLNTSDDRKIAIAVTWRRNRRQKQKGLTSRSLQVLDFLTIFWCRLPVSNWPPDDYKSTALPNELSRRY
jgi:ADP-ribose pyrophosphatase YjhB (NUDIX family)